MASAKFASALSRVIWAIFSLSDRKPVLAVCELVSNVFHVRSLVAAKVSKARFACSMLTFIRSRNESGTSGFMNPSFAMALSCPRNCSSSAASSAAHRTLHNASLAERTPFRQGKDVAPKPQPGGNRAKSVRWGQEFALQAPRLASYWREGRKSLQGTGHLTTRLIVSEPYDRLL